MRVCQRSRRARRAAFAAGGSSRTISVAIDIRKTPSDDVGRNAQKKPRMTSLPPPDLSGEADFHRASPFSSPTASIGHDLHALDTLISLEPDLEAVDVGVRLAAVIGNAVDGVCDRRAEAVAVPREVLLLRLAFGDQES